MTEAVARDLSERLDKLESAQKSFSNTLKQVMTTLKNPSAKALRTPEFRPKVIQSKKRYVRKKIKLDEIDDI